MANEVLPKLFDRVLRCERCSTEYPITHESRTCPNDAGQLVVADGDRLIGSVIAGRYVVESLLGIGGWSSVYLAEDRQLKRPVAVKILHYHLCRDEESTTRFQRESVLAASLNHPNITMMFDFGVLANGQSFIVMEYLEGSTLEVVASFDKQLSMRRTVDILCQICDAMDYAHKKGVIHRDLKPCNVLVLDSGFVKVMDFGLAKYLAGSESLTGTGQVMGTPTYMSPEQCRGDDIDGRSDIYCLGLLGHYMLTGEHSIKADTILEAMHRQVVEAPSRLSDLRPELSFSPALEGILVRCLSKNPADRFQNCLELKSALQAADITDVDTSSDRRRFLVPTLKIDKKLAIIACAILVPCMTIVAAFWIGRTSRIQKQESVARSESAPFVPRVTTEPSSRRSPAVKRTANPSLPHPPYLSYRSPKETSAKDQPVVARSLPNSVTSPQNDESGALLLPRPVETTDTTVVGNHLPKYEANFVVSNLSSPAAVEAELSSVSDCRSLQIIRSKVDDRVVAYAIQRFPSLTKITLPGTRITDKGLALISSSNASIVSLRNTSTTDAGLLNLQRASKIDHLDLTANHISDVGVKNISIMPLQFLGINCTDVTDESAESLSKMSALEALGLEGTKFGDLGLQRIAKLSNLKELNCNKTRITDASMHYLANMPALSALGLAGTSVTDAGIATLSVSPTLTKLDLRDTAVTQAALNSLLSMKKLRVVRLSNPSGDMVAMLRNAHITVQGADDRFYTTGGMSIAARTQYDKP